MSNYRIFHNGQPVQIISVDLGREIEVDENDEEEDENYGSERDSE